MSRSPHITVGKLSVVNLRQKPVRTGALVAIIAMLTFALFGGSVLTKSLSNGLNGMEERLGSDLVVVPAGTETSTASMLVSGEPTSFYFDKNIEADILAVAGVEAVSSQIYISSLDAACCEDEVQIIGFDPESDFVVEPWIAQMNLDGVEDGQMIVGADIIVSDNNTVLFFDHEYPVAGQLAKTGTSVDSTVFISQDSIPELVEYASAVGAEVMPAEYAGKAVSAVLVKASEGVSAEEIAYSITQAAIYGISFVYPDGITQTTGTSLHIVVAFLVAIIVTLWVISLVVLGSVFSANMNERKKELATLRIMGVTKWRLISLVASESSLIGLIGGAVGITLAALVVFPFSNLIGNSLSLPYLTPGFAWCAMVAVLALAVALLTAVGASAFGVKRIAKVETMLTLRDGE